MRTRGLGVCRRASARESLVRAAALCGAWLVGAAMGLLPAVAQAAEWEPTAPIELVVPAGAGGGADQMARLIQGLVKTHGLAKQAVQVVNLSGNSGAEGLLAMKAAKGNPHKLVVTLSNLFTTPLATGVAFNWRDLTPVTMMALDQFVLWVPADSPIQSAKDAVRAIAARPQPALKLGGTGASQEDQLISVLLETAANGHLTYVPLKGGGDVAKALVDHQVDFTVNNPIEAEAHWRAGKLRPLCVFDGAPLPYPARLSHGSSWADIPTCMSAGIPVQYLMLRGVFTTPGATPAQVAYYERLLQRVREQPEWQAFMSRGALKATAMSGPAFTHWLDRAENFHKVLMREAHLSAR